MYRFLRESTSENIPNCEKRPVGLKDDSTENKENYTVKKVVQKAISTKTAKSVVSAKNPQIALLFGYVGIGHDGFIPNRNRHSNSLYNNIVQAIFCAEYPEKKLHLTSLKPACRTGTNSSALGQVVVIPAIKDNIEELVAEINENLPDYVKCFGGRQVPFTFHPKFSCLLDSERSNFQVFKYILPSFALDSEYNGNLDGYRVPDDIIPKVFAILKEFEGKHSFHNFNGIGEPKSKSKYSSARFIKSIEVGETEVWEELEFVTFTFTGENFMINQICCIIGFVVAYMRGFANKQTMINAWKKSLLDLPKAPSNGLFLDEVSFGTYNKQMENRNGPEDEKQFAPLIWSSEFPKIRELRQRIMVAIVQCEKKGKLTANWIKTLENYSYKKRTVKTNLIKPKSKPKSKKDLSKKKLDHLSVTLVNEILGIKTKKLQSTLMDLVNQSLNTILKEL